MSDVLRNFNVEISLDEGEIRNIEAYTGKIIKTKTDLYSAIFTILRPVIMPNALNPPHLAELKEEDMDGYYD